MCLRDEYETNFRIVRSLNAALADGFAGEIAVFQLDPFGENARNSLSHVAFATKGLHFRQIDQTRLVHWPLIC